MSGELERGDIPAEPMPSATDWRARRAEGPSVEVWIANGLRKRWRVVSIDHTFGEWEDYSSAQLFADLLVQGNPDYRRLS